MVGTKGWGRVEVSGTNAGQPTTRRIAFSKLAEFILANMLHWEATRYARPNAKSARNNTDEASLFSPRISRLSLCLLATTATTVVLRPQPEEDKYGGGVHQFAIFSVNRALKKSPLPLIVKALVKRRRQNR